MPTEEDWAFFHRCEEALHALYEGQWVLIHQGRLIGVYERMDDVLAAASGLGHCLIQPIGPVPAPRDTARLAIPSGIGTLASVNTCPVCHRETHLSTGEEPDPRRHCICPPAGPVWLAMAQSRLGRANKLDAAWLHAGLAMQPGEVPYWLPAEGARVGTWGTLSHDGWARWLDDMWPLREK